VAGGSAVINFELLAEKDILVITPEGPLERSDFDNLAKSIDPLIESKGKLAGLMIYTKSFPGWENFGAFVSHIRFVGGHHRKIERIAAVTDSGFLKIMPSIAQHFVDVQVRHFSFEEKDQAFAWLKSDR
jgi:tRNA U38,U39,U40 pseudouridine synthase TruA